MGDPGNEFSLWGVLAVGDDLETTPSRWALRSGEAERIAVWCQAGEAWAEGETCSTWLGLARACPVPCRLWLGWEEDVGALWPRAASLPAACCY